MENISVRGGTLVDYATAPVEVERQEVVQTIASVNEGNPSVKGGSLVVKRIEEVVDVIQGGLKAMEQPQPASPNPDRPFYQSFREGITPPTQVKTQAPSMVQPKVEESPVLDETITSPEIKTKEPPIISKAEVEKEPTIDGTASGVQSSAKKESILEQSQALLKETGHYRSGVDGVSGPSTTNAVKTFQYENGLEVTGELDMQTRVKLGSGRTSKRPEISDTNNPLLSFIAKGESGGYGAANDYNPDTEKATFGVMDSFFSERYGKPLDQLTVSQVQDIQSGGYGTREVFAVGAYQMTPETFNEGVQALGLTGDEVFNKELQDRIAIEYLAGSKRSKLQAWLRGEQNVTRAEAHEELAKEWASIPIGKSVTRKGQTMKRGESYYTPEGNVANAHTAEEVEALLDSLRPKNVGLDVPTTTDQGQEQ